MSYLIEILGRGLLSDLSAAFRERLADDKSVPTAQLKSAIERESTGQNDKQALARCWTALGRRRLTEGELGAARDAFTRALEFDPGDCTARIAAACAHDGLGRTDLARDCLLQARRQSPHDAQILFGLGYCHERLGQAAEALEAYEAALAGAPELSAALARLAAICLSSNDVGRAIDCYERLCWCEPGDVSLSLTLANLYVQQGRFPDAVRQFEFALTIDPDNWELHDDLVTDYERAGLLHEAIDALSAMIASQPPFADHHMRLGNLLVKLEQNELAAVQFRRALELSPDSLDALVKLGTAHLRGGRYVDAVQCFSRAVEINDRTLAGYVGLAVAQHEAGDHDQARASFELAACVEPNSTILLSETARLQLKIGASRQLNRYLPVGSSPCEPAHPPASNPSASLDTGDPAASPDVMDRLLAEQIRRHQTVLIERPQHADLHYRLGVLLRQAGRLPEAIAAFRRAVQINPTYAKALVKLGLALHAAGQSREAIDILRRAIHLRPDDAPLHYELGLMFADRRDFALAVEQFEDAVRRAPHNLDFHANLALALQNMGLLDRASACWRTFSDLIAVGPAPPPRDRAHDPEP